jgi:hypothetical protein
MPQHTWLVPGQSESALQNLSESAAGSQNCCGLSSESRAHSCPVAVSHAELSAHFLGQSLAFWQMLPAPP